MDHALDPDPACGVFSTMLVVDRRPVELDPHLARLRESVRALYGVELTRRAAELVAEQARGWELGRVRLACRLGADGALRLEAHAGPIDRALVLPAGGVDLRSAPVRNWNGAHKWVDRRMLERLEAAAAPASALLVARDGGVLETTRANVFALGEDGVLRTPPANGSILPGVTRGRTIAIAGELGVTVREAPLAPEALLAAQEVFTTGSIRGIEPVRSLDGAPVGRRSELIGAVADVLRGRVYVPATRAVRSARSSSIRTTRSANSPAT